MCTAGDQHKRIAQYLSVQGTPHIRNTLCSIPGATTYKVNVFVRNHTWRRTPERTEYFSVFCSFHHVLHMHTCERAHKRKFCYLPKKQSRNEEDLNEGKEQQRKEEKKIPKRTKYIFYCCFACKFLGSLFVLHRNWIINISEIFLSRPTQRGWSLEMATKRDKTKRNENSVR